MSNPGGHFIHRIFTYALIFGDTQIAKDIGSLFIFRLFRHSRDNVKMNMLMPQRFGKLYHIRFGAVRCLS